MENEDRLIYADALKKALRTNEGSDAVGHSIVKLLKIDKIVDTQPTVDAVEMETLKAWLYEIAMNNTGNYLCDSCEEIISRLDGLRSFAKERKE